MMVVALLAWRTSSMNDASEAAISGMASLEANGAGRSEEAAIYTAPPATDFRRMASPPVRLTNYMMQHGEYASRLSRTSVHSNVVTTGQPDVPGDNGSEDQ